MILETLEGNKVGAAKPRSVKLPSPLLIPVTNSSMRFLEEIVRPITKIVRKSLNSYFTKEDIQMASKHMKKSPLLHRDVLIKTVRDAPSPTLARMRMRSVAPETLKSCPGGVSISSNPLETSHCPLKWNVLLFSDPAIPLLGMYPGEMSIYIHQTTCRRIFMAALFLIAPNRNEQVSNNCRMKKNRGQCCHIAEYWALIKMIQKNKP